MHHPSSLQLLLEQLNVPALLLSRDGEALAYNLQPLSPGLNRQLLALWQESGQADALELALPFPDNAAAWPSCRLSVTSDGLLVQWLAASSQRYDPILLNGCGLLLGLVDRNGLLLAANDTACQFMAMSRADALNRPLWELLQWKESTPLKLAEAIRRAADGECGRFYSSRTLPSGGQLTIELRLCQIRDPFSQENLVLIEAQDVSAQHAAEAELRISEERFRLITEHVDDLIAILDPQGVRLYNSPSYARVLGDEAVQVGQDSFQTLHPDDSERVRKIFAQTVQSGVGSRAEFRYLLPNGSVRFVESNSNVIRNNRGEVYRVLVVGRDVTERKSHEMELQRINSLLERRVQERTEALIQANAALEYKVSEQERLESALWDSFERTRLIIDTASDAVISVNPVGQIVDWNLQAEHSFGWNHEEAFHCDIAELVIPDAQREGFRQALLAVFADDGADRRHKWRAEMQVMRRDGVEFPVELSAWPLKVGEGRLVIAFIRDITERRKLELAVQRSAAQVRQHRNVLLELTQLDKSNFQPALQQILTAARSTLTVERCSFWYLGDEQQPMRLAASVPPLLRNGPSTQVAAVAAEQLGRLRREPLAAANMQHSAVPDVVRGYGLEHNIGAFISVPVLSHGEVIGLLFVVEATERDWTLEEVEFVSSIGIMIALVDEASRRLSAEQELNRNEQKYRQVINLTSEGFWLGDQQHATLECNDALCRMLGYAAEELVGARLPDLVVESGRRQLAQVLSRIRQSRHYTLETELLSRDGTHVPVVISATSVTDPDGERQFSFAFITDITERKLLQDSLQSSLMERETILQTVMIGLVLTIDRRLVWCNQIFSEMIGLANEELVGRLASFSFLDEDDFKSWGEYAYPKLNAGESVVLERQMRRADGAVFWARLSGRMIVHDDPNRGTIWAIIDISDRKRTEEEMARNLARERELSELKTRFVSMASHEFRTPLSTIQSSVELIEHYGDSLASEEKREILHDVQDAVQHMTTMLEDVLLYGRAEGHSLHSQPLWLNARALCRRLLKELRLDAVGRHPVQFDYQCEDTLLLDEKLLRHILLNLLANAAKYSPQGGAIGLRVYRDQQQVLFEVEDHGIGIPEQDQAKLLDSFFRASNVGNISGTGLGLAIVKRAVDAHGGTLSWRSAVGEGTRFIVALPQADTAQNAIQGETA